MTTRGARVAIVNAFHVSVGRNIAVGSVVVWESGTPEKVSGSPGARRRERASQPTARAAMAPALGKRPRSAGGAGSGKTCVHGKAQGEYYCKECPGQGICEHGRQRSQCKECGGSGICEHGRVRHRCNECRSARDAAARVLCPPVNPSILVEPEDVEDPGDEV